jgi:hypothetical protein
MIFQAIKVERKNRGSFEFSPQMHSERIKDHLPQQTFTAEVTLYKVNNKSSKLC